MHEHKYKVVYSFHCLVQILISFKRIKTKKKKKQNSLQTSFSIGDHTLFLLSFLFSILLLFVLILAGNLTGSCRILVPIGLWPGSEVQAHRKAILAINWKEFIRVAEE